MCGHLCGAVDSAHEACEGFAGCELVHFAGDVGDEPLAAVGPAYGLGELGGEARAALVGGGVGLGCDVGEDGAGGVGDSGAGERFAEAVGGVGHEGGVEGAGDGELGGAEACGFGGGERAVAGFEVAGEDDLARGVEVGADEDAFASCLVADEAGAVFVGTDECDHGGWVGVGGVLHCLAAERDEAEAVGEGEGAGEVEGGVFAEGEACGGGGCAEVFGCVGAGFDESAV